MSRVEIDARGRRVTIDHDGELAHLVDTARQLWDHTNSAEPDKPTGEVVFVTGQRYEPSPVAHGAGRWPDRG